MTETVKSFEEIIDCHIRLGARVDFGLRKIAEKLLSLPFAEYLMVAK